MVRLHKCKLELIIFCFSHGSLCVCSCPASFSDHLFTFCSAEIEWLKGVWLQDAELLLCFKVTDSNKNGKKK